MRPRTWALIVGVGVAFVVTAVLALSSADDEAQGRPRPTATRTATDHGIRWRFSGRSVVVSATEDVRPAVRRRLAEDLSVGCSRVPTIGSSAKAVTGVGAARFTRIPGTIRVRLSPRITRADVCFIELARGSEDVASVRFPADAYPSTSGGAVPSDGDRRAIVDGLVRHFDAKVAEDRRAECATYTENAADAVAADLRMFVRHPARATDCVSAYREVVRDRPADSVGLVPVEDQRIRALLRKPDDLEIRVRNGRARVSGTGTKLDFGYELLRVADRWLVDRLPGRS